MKPPADLPSVLVATGEALARRLGIDPPLFWAYLYRRAAPPADVRAALVEAFFPRVAPDDFLIEGSTSVPNGTRVVEPVQGQALIGGSTGRPTLEHPFTRALHERGKTLAEWAKLNRLDRGTVKWWYVKDGRPIPRKWADAIAAELGVPATVRTWRNGIREPK